METFKHKFLSKEGESVEFETKYPYLILDITHNTSVYRELFDGAYLHDWQTSEEEALKSLWRIVLNSNDNYVVSEDGEFIYNNDSKDQEPIYAKGETEFFKDGHRYNIRLISEMIEDRFINTIDELEGPGNWLLERLNSLSETGFKINKI
jgi:hypothetical protein